jgi:hypothetical protein
LGVARSFPDFGCLTADSGEVMASVTVRDLRNHGGEVLDRVARGELERDTGRSLHDERPRSSSRGASAVELRGNSFESEYTAIRGRRMNAIPWRTVPGGEEIQMPPTDSPDKVSDIRTLPEVECFELLAVAVVGRVGFDRQPVSRSSR